MSVGIVRVAKMTKGSVKGIEIHDLRKKDISHTNKDINWERTKENYDLHLEQNCNFHQSIKKRIDELDLPKAVRKDAVLMAQVLVTSDFEFFKDLSKEHQQQFFKDSYNFLTERYGKENTISATVHLDERTPHMHFNFVPVTSDGRLSAKSVLTRQSLIEQQTAFFEQVGKKHGLSRGQTKAERIEKGNYRKNMTMPEYKAYTSELEKVKEKLARVEQDKLEALKIVSKAQEDLEHTRTRYLPLKSEYEAFKGYLDTCDKESQISIMIPDYAKVKKSLLGKETVTVPKEKWEERHISAGEKIYLKKARANFEKVVAEFKETSTADYISYLQKELEDKNKDISSLYSENYDLKRENLKLSNKVKSAESILSRLPENVKKQIMQKTRSDLEL